MTNRGLLVGLAAAVLVSGGREAEASDIHRSVSTDNCDAAVLSCHITSITSSEPVPGTGDGDTSPDWEITGDLTADLRAERAGGGPGRIYTLTVECGDAAGNGSRRTVAVTVPHN